MDKNRFILRFIIGFPIATGCPIVTSAPATPFLSSMRRKLAQFWQFFMFGTMETDAWRKMLAQQLSPFYGRPRYVILLSNVPWYRRNYDHISIVEMVLSSDCPQRNMCSRLYYWYFLRWLGTLRAAFCRRRLVFWCRTCSTMKLL